MKSLEPGHAIYVVEVDGLESTAESKKLSSLSYEFAQSGRFAGCLRDGNYDKPSSSERRVFHLV